MGRALRMRLAPSRAGPSQDGLVPWAIAAIPTRTWCSSGSRGQLGGIQNLCSCLYSRTFDEFLRHAEQASRPQTVPYGSSRGPRLSYCASRHYGG